MRILFLTRSFNSLTQRLFLDLSAAGHQVSVEFDIADSVSIEAMALFRPELVIAPFLKRAIPEAVWREHVCLVVHPGIEGDRGPSALDWAISRGETDWGVTVLQAQAEMDAGPVWAAERFALRRATKSSLYRNEVTEAASRAVLSAVRRFEAGAGPLPVQPAAPGNWRALMRQPERAIDWQRDSTEAVLRKLHAGDGSPGVLDTLFDAPCQLFDGHAEPLAAGHRPGQVIACDQQAVLRATRDGAVWIGHVRRNDPAGQFKLPTALAFASEVAGLPPWPDARWQRIRYEGDAEVGLLHFDFYNGAMGTALCRQLQSRLQSLLQHPPRVLVLMGGPDFWSNGIHLNLIEAAQSPADESWRNINAIDDLTLALIEATSCLVVAALHGNAGAGGAFMALAADRVWAREGVLMNPHYKNMGNLYGSEYWTYLLPRRLRATTAQLLLSRRLPLSAVQAQQHGLVDELIGARGEEFTSEVRRRATALARNAQWPAWLEAKRQRRAADEAQRPLAEYRAAELAQMHRNFYGFDPSYHIARANFIRRVPPSWTPRHLALHRSTAGAATGQAARGT